MSLTISPAVLADRFFEFVESHLLGVKSGTGVVVDGSHFRLRNADDNTKYATFGTTGLTGVRTLTLPDADGTLRTSANTLTQVMNLLIDGGGTVITTGAKGDLPVPFAATITAVELLPDQSGSIVVDIWKDTYANFPPTNADTITASAKPTISSATKAQDTTLTGWTTAVAAGDILRFNVDSCTSITRCTVAVTFTRSL